MTFQRFVFSLLAALTLSPLWAQPLPETEVVEVSGVIIVKTPRDRKEPVPFATVLVKGSGKGTYSNFQGIFSLVVRKGETLVFSSVGYEPTEMVVPVATDGAYKTVVVEMTPAEIQVEEVVVFPWPDRNNLRAEFLAMQPDEALVWQDLAQRNLEAQRMLALAESMSMDGRENGAYYLQMQAREFGYMGQRPATPIFDPLAWARFFKSLKEKKKTEERKDLLDD